MRVPTFNDPEITRTFNDLLKELEDFKREILSSVTANRSLLLYSPGKKVFEITVSDAGVITATKVSG